MQIERFIKESKVYKSVISGREIETRVTETLKSLGLNFDQALVLVAIFGESKPLSPSELVPILGTSKSRLSQILSHLEEMQFLRRVVNPNDARRYLLKPRSERRADISKVVNSIERIERSL